jgi:hypothetical protein
MCPLNIVPAQVYLPKWDAPDRMFMYGEYLSILNEGTEPLAKNKK